MRKTTGTSPNEAARTTGRMMQSDQAALYILSDAPAGDPLDCVAAAAPHFAPHYAAIHQVGPGKAMSARALRRAYEPGVDRLLYDFTPPGDHGWAVGMQQDAPAAALIGGDSPFAPDAALADLRAARRYAARGEGFSPDVMTGVLDARSSPISARLLTRPAIAITPPPDGTDLMLAVAPGAIETAYAALLGLRAKGAVTCLAVTRRDANDLTDIAAAFGMAAARIRFVRDRAGLLAAVAAAGGLIDIHEAAAPAVSDAAFVAGCIGAPVLDLTAPIGAAAAAEAFAASKPRKNPAAATGFAAARPMASFADDLHALIEAGFARARQPVAAA